MVVGIVVHHTERGINFPQASRMGGNNVSSPTATFCVPYLVTTIKPIGPFVNQRNWIDRERTGSHPSTIDGSRLDAHRKVPP